MDWFDEIERACRTRGWIWADVAGYDFYYFGNDEFWNLMGPNYDPPHDDQFQPHTEGLKQYLSKDVTCDFADGHAAQLGPIDEYHNGFYRIYELDRFGEVDASRPLNDSPELMRDMALYEDTAPSKKRMTTALLMNGPSEVGTLIHSGMAPNEDDYAKGYIATALAIEEARAHVMEPKPKDGVYEGNPHVATFSVSIVPGSEGYTNIPELGDCNFIDLLFTMNSYYEETSGWSVYYDDLGLPHIYHYWHYCEIEDLDLTRAGTNVLFDTDDRAGIDTIAGENQLMEKIGWWAAGQTATAFLLLAGQKLGTPLPFAGLVSLIPIYLSTITPPDSNMLPGDHNWINGIKVDTDKDYECSSVIRCRVYFPLSSGQYSFNCQMVSWISYRTDILGSLPDYRVQSLIFTDTLDFTVEA